MKFTPFPVRQILKLVVISMAIVLGFQNCSPVSFQLLEKFNDEIKSDNNGANYGGKPSGTYYHLVPEFSCEGNPNPVGEIDINSSGITYMKNLSTQCNAMTQTLTSFQIDN